MWIDHPYRVVYIRFIGTHRRRDRIGAILNARRGITADTAPSLARFFGTTPEFWLNLQQSHDPKLALRAQGGRIAKTVRPRAGAGEPVAPS